MGSHLLTLNIPDPLYRRLKDRAEKRHRTVEDETLEALTATVPVGGELPSDLEEVISPLDLLDDESLWRAARSHLADELVQQLETLHLKKQREGLTEGESLTLSSL